MPQGFSKVTLSVGMKAMDECNLEVFVLSDGNLEPFEGSSDELVFESAIYIRTSDSDKLDV